MKRLIIFCLTLLLLLSTGAQASLERNSFFCGEAGKGSFAWDGRYVYWIKIKDEIVNGQEWKAQPYTEVLRSELGGEAELLLKGSANFYVNDLWDTGTGLLLAIGSLDIDKPVSPYLMDYDGGNLRKLSGQIGECRRVWNMLYNCTDEGIYEIPLQTLKPKKIYSFDTTQGETRLVQVTANGLYFETLKSPYQYERTLWVYDYWDAKVPRTLLNVSYGHSLFVDGDLLYYSDPDLDGCRRINLGTNTEKVISEKKYVFLTGNDRYLFAKNVTTSEGVVFSRVELGNCTDIEEARLGTWDPTDLVFGDTLLHFDEATQMFSFDAITYD